MSWQLTPGGAYGGSFPSTVSCVILLIIVARFPIECSYYKDKDNCNVLPSRLVYSSTKMPEESGHSCDGPGCKGRPPFASKSELSSHIYQCHVPAGTQYGYGFLMRCKAPMCDYRAYRDEHELLTQHCIEAHSNPKLAIVALKPDPYDLVEDEPDSLQVVKYRLSEWIGHNQMSRFAPSTSSFAKR